MKKVIINGIDLSTYKLVYESHYFPSPLPKTSFIDIPYGNGQLDLTEAIVPYPVFNNREGTISLGIMRGQADFYQSEDTLRATFLGKSAVVTIDDSWEYIGRVIDLQFEHTYGFLRVVFMLNLKPYKLKPTITSLSYTINGTNNIQITNSSMPTTVKLITDEAIQLEVGSNSYSFNAGTHTIPVKLLSGLNEWEFIGTANITLEYQEGAI